MKNILKLISVIYIMAFISCKADKSFDMSGTLKNAKDGIVVLYVKDPHSKYIAFDTAIVIDGIFKFEKQTLSEPKIANLEYFSPNGSRKVFGKSTFWIENSKIEVEGAVGNANSFRITKSNLNEDVTNLGSFWEFNAAENNRDVSKLARSKIYNDRIFNIVNKNSNSYYSLYGIYQYSKLIPLLDNASADKKVSKLLASLNFEYSSFPITKRILHQKDILSKSSIGKYLPDFYGFNSNNAKFLSSSSNSKITLIEFWSLGCKPCIADIPALRMLYSNHNNQGFDIISISLDYKYPSYWSSFLKENSLPWTNIIELQEQDKKLTTYLDINIIPQNILIDENKKILARNLSMGELGEFLNKYFDSN